MLHHVSLEVHPSQADRFGELLRTIGFEPATAPGVLGDAVHWYERASTQVHLILSEAATAPVLGHAAFVVDRYEETIGKLRGSGFEINEARELWGAPRSFLLAPGGHRLELMAAPPP